MNGYPVSRPFVLSVAKLIILGVSNVPLIDAAPLQLSSYLSTSSDGGKSTKDPSLWLYLGTAVFLVLLGGVFAGLTIALMGQDDVNLQVIQASGEGSEKKNAGSVLRLLKRGKHWVLVTLLLGNVITNETLPIVLDRSLGGGWPAVLGSTALIVIFGEIIPQSICVRFGLPIGAWMAPVVLVLMYVLGPVAWPTAKLLDWLLGEEQGNLYKKAGLKTLVDLHKTLGTSPNERLNQDEVTIISAVLDLKEKSVGSIMTPMEDVFTMSSDTVLDEETMDVILSAGYSRIPIHAPDNDQNFVGMLLVKILITYDPEDAKHVSDFALATLPETRPETSCLDIVNFFQEGKSHMVLVSDHPGEDHGALGVVTLEDVIEELIGEEIIDESDVFIDVHKAIRRLTPAPKARDPKYNQMARTENVKHADMAVLIDIGQDEASSSRPSRHASVDGAGDWPGHKKSSTAELSSSPRTTFQMRKHSGNTCSGPNSAKSGAMRGNAPEMRDHLKHLGPSNLASRPRQTRYNTVKIKPGGRASMDEGALPAKNDQNPKTTEESSQADTKRTISYGPEGGEGAGLLQSAGREAKDGAQAVHSGYGSLTSPPEALGKHLEGGKGVPRKATTDDGPRPKSPPPSRTWSQSTVESLPDTNRDASASRHPPHRGVARSGSITENVVHAGGVRKVVLETTSSSDDAEDGVGSASRHRKLSQSQQDDGNPSESAIVDDAKRDGGSNSALATRSAADTGNDKKKKRRKKKKAPGKGNGSEAGEDTPLLDRQE